MDTGADSGSFKSSSNLVRLELWNSDRRRAAPISVDADTGVDLSGFVEHHIDALWLIRQGGTVIYLNERARRLDTANYPIRFTQDGRLVLADGDGQTDLSASINAAMAQPAKASVFVCEANARPTYQISVAPAGRRIDLECAVILIRDLAEIARMRSKAAEILYSLTPSEVRVLEALLQGLTPHEVASVTGTKITTVRTQIASVLSKARVKRQADLLAQVSNFPAF